MERYVYKEDHQSYKYVPIVFETDTKLSIEGMKEVSHSKPGSGRISTSFDAFKWLMEDRGDKVVQIEILADDSELPKDIPVVIGAAGNY